MFYIKNHILTDFKTTTPISDKGATCVIKLIRNGAKGVKVANTVV